MTALPTSAAPRRPIAALAAALAMLATGLLAVGMLNPWSLVWVDRLLDHPILILTMVFGLLSFAVASTGWRSWAKVLILVGGILLYLYAVLMAFLLSGLGGTGSSTITPAPNGRPYEAVMVEGIAVIDPIWSVSIRQTSGLFAHEWYVGCVNGDAPGNSLTSLRWDGPERLVLSTEQGDEVAVDVAADGRPTVAADPGVLGCPGDE